MQISLHSLPYYRWLIFSVTALGTFMSTLDSSIVNVALPNIAEELQVSVPIAQWIVSAYLLTISSLLPLIGRFGDMYGRKKIYSWGFLIFTLGSAFCGAAANVWVLVGARVVQAVGAAMLMANAPALVAANFPPGNRGKALGMTGMIVALGSMTGPSVGGFLVSHFNWPSIFYVNLPIGVIGVVSAYAILPQDVQHHRGSFDYGGAVLFAVSMLCFLTVLSHGQEWGWLSMPVLAAAVIAGAGAILFIRHERTVRHPMINLRLFRHWPFSAGNLSGLLAFMAMFCNSMILPFFLHSVLGYTPAQIGLAMTAFPLVMAVVAPFSGQLSDRVGPVVLTTLGMGMVTAGLLYQSTLTVGSSMLQVALGQAIIGFGHGMFQSPNNNSVLSSVPAEYLGIASGINALVRNVGMVSGIAVSVSVYENRRYYALLGIDQPTSWQETTALLSGYHWAVWTGAFLAFLGMIVSFNRKGYAAETAKKP